MKTVIITGAASGIGAAVTQFFVNHPTKSFKVIGVDPRFSVAIRTEKLVTYPTDIRKITLVSEDLQNINIIINNAGVVNSGEDIDINLKGTIQFTEMLLDNCPNLTSILFNTSASALTGFEFPEYAASKSGLTAYMKNVACRVAPKGITCNAIALGGVLTDSNKPVMDDSDSWERIMSITPLKKWASLDEIAQWFYFLTVTNQSASGQTFLVDNGEKDLNDTFVWPTY